MNINHKDVCFKLILFFQEVHLRETYQKFNFHGNGRIRGYMKHFKQSKALFHRALN
jgi:hypothetical protein